VIATRASGTLRIGALIEQAVIVDSDAHLILSGEVAELTDNLYRALLASIDSASSPTRTCVTVTDTNPIGTIGNRL
jgi:hypothetical protein